MSRINAICVYCASGPGTNPAFVTAARNFGRILAENSVRLVYGGGSIGLMGALAESVIDHGGQVTGVIPDFLVARELMLQRAQERIITRDMHERKRIMFERADAFVALPGGIGTLEELVEQLTWAQLGRHKKPILLANIDGFWDPLCALLDHGGRVTGVIPEFLTGREHVMARAQEVVVTRDMHERKRIMFERADAFVALPGGVGTLEELVEQLTWAQLGRHKKPILIANIEQFWEPLLALLDHMRKLEFIRNGLTFNLLKVECVEDILPKLIAAAQPVPETEKEMVPVAAERM